MNAGRLIVEKGARTAADVAPLAACAWTFIPAQAGSWPASKLSVVRLPVAGTEVGPEGVEKRTAPGLSPPQSTVAVRLTFWDAPERK